MKANAARTTVLGLIDALNGGDETDVVLRRFSRSEVLSRKVRDYRAEYPNFRIVPLDLFAELDLVVVRFALDLDGRYGPDGGVADGHPDLLEAIAICRVKGAAITEMWLEMDVFGQVVASHANGGERSASGRALEERILTFEAGFPGFDLVADEVIAAGEKVAVRFHTKLRHAYEFMGLAATGVQLSITGIIILRVAGGEIVDHWLQVDMWTLLLRLQEGADDDSIAA